MTRVTVTKIKSNHIFDGEIQISGHENALKPKAFRSERGSGYMQFGSVYLPAQKVRDGEQAPPKVYLNVTIFTEELVMDKPGYYQVKGKLSFSQFNGKIQLSVNAEASDVEFVESAEDRFGPGRLAPKSKFKAEDEEAPF